MRSDRSLLDEQIAYYRARAAEYDQWFLRQGRYDRGPEQRARWFRELATVELALQSFAPLVDVLELACGTGLWTRQLAKISRRVRAVDASPEAIAINRKRVNARHVSYRVADLFAWAPAARFDFVFFAFWLSHVPPERFDRFWHRLGTCLRRHGRVVFVDSLREPSSTAIDHHLPDHSSVLQRRLNDGREFEIVKVFYDPLALERRLAAAGWSGAVRSTPSYFLYGAMERMPRSAIAVDTVEPRR